MKPKSKAFIDQDQIKLTKQLCFALYSASLTMTKVYKPILTALELTYPQYIVLLALLEVDETMSLSGLGNQLYLDSGTLTPLIKKMQLSGLLTRKRSKLDERSIEIALSLKGRELAQSAAKVAHAKAAKATGCSLQERESLTQLLKQLRNSLASNIASSKNKESL